MVAFGGYFGSSSITNPIAFEFFNAMGTSIGTDQLLYSPPNNDGTREWTGWDFSEPVSPIEYSGQFVVNDALQFDLIPDPYCPSSIRNARPSGESRSPQP